MTLTRERRGEIAWVLLKLQIKKDGIQSFYLNDFKRNLGNIRKKTGIPSGELREFSLDIFTETFQDLITGIKNMEMEAD